MKLPSKRLIALFIIAGSLTFSAYCTGAPSKGKKSQSKPITPVTEIINNGREPGDYYVLPHSQRKVKLTTDFKNQAEIIAFMDKEFSADLKFCQPSWCVVLVDIASGAWAWDVMYFERSDIKEAKPWKLRRIYNTKLHASTKEEWPGIAEIDNATRTLIFRGNDGRNIDTLGLPPPIK